MSPSLIDPSVPTHLERILLKCLALSPEDRFDSIEEIMLELNRVDPSDQALAGREEVIQQIAQCLQRVHQGEQLHVHFVGTRGSGKTWAKDTLCEAALQQGLPTYVLDSNESSKAFILEQIAHRLPLVVCSRGHEIPKLGLPLVTIEIEWLGLSQLRRSLFSHAPRTPNLTEKSQWLYEQTKGIPALLLPMLLEYTIRDAFHLPQNPELLLPDSWVNNISDTHWEVLCALTYLDRALTTKELTTIIPSCTDSILAELRHRSLIKKHAMTWRISCLLVASYVKRHQQIDTTLRQRWREELTVDVRSAESIHRCDRRAQSTRQARLVLEKIWRRADSARPKLQRRAQDHYGGMSSVRGSYVSTRRVDIRKKLCQ